MITFTQSDYRRELYICGGWNLPPDDDLPRTPECDDLDSAQRKRYLRETLCNPGRHQPAGGTQAHQIGASGCVGDPEGPADLD